jgi:hypothetical protein|tara:strand:- start:236 stop:505 length:270 start_codon:yes stop_codon:yes gene_type:complete
MTFDTWKEKKLQEVKNNKDDAVEHPRHYTSGSIECIEAIEASMTNEEFIGYLRGNAMKYQWRHRTKTNATQDLEKSIWYTNKLIERYKK